MNDKREEINNTDEINNNARPVRSFAVQNINGSQEIKERLEASKKTNLNNDSKITSKDTVSELPESRNTLPKKDELESNEDKINKNSNLQNITNDSNRSDTKKAKQDQEFLENIEKKQDDVNKVLKNVKETPAKVKAIISFFKTPLGKLVLIILLSLIGLFLLVALATILSNLFQLVISSIGIKFGLSGEYSYMASTETNEEYNYYYFNEDRVYEEGMTRGEVEEMVKNAKDEDGNPIACRLTFFQKVKLFLGIEDGTDPCEFMESLKRRTKKREYGELQNIAPGYIMNTFYYAFETQNYKLNGEPFITDYIETSAEKDDQAALLDIKQITSDLDAINLLFGHKRANGKYLFRPDDIDVLLDEYIYQENYKYWRWELVDEETNKYECVEKVRDKTRKIDVDKYKIFLRYGKVAAIGSNAPIKYGILNELDKMPKSGNRGYEGDKNFIASYQATSPECQTGCTNCYEDNYGTPPSDLEVYKIKAMPDEKGDDGAALNLSTGTFDYRNGFIFTRYPRYMEEFTVYNEVKFDYIVAKEIEKFIVHISDRQDYANYLLGYKSDVGDLVGTKGNGGNGTSTIICDYTELDGSNIGSTDTNLQVQLTFPDKSAFTFNNFDFESNADMEGQLISLEKYVLGAVYMEAGGEYGQADYYVTSVETTSKAFSVMVRSFVLAAGSSDGSTIRISNSTQRQTYCDPDEGCYVCPATNNSNNVIVMPIDSELAKNAPNCIKKDPLPQNSPLREYVKATAGQVMTDSSGKVALTQYDTTKLSDWHTDQSLANYDYAEMLYYLYGNQGYELNGVECEIITTGGGSTDIASGPWDSWKQCGPWGDQPFGTDATLCSAGCLITSYAKLIADANPSTLKIPNFNPQTFAQALNENNCFSGNELLNYCALDTAVGAGNYTYGSGSLTGTFENKRAQVESFLNQGYYVIISVKSNGHWVYVTGTTANDILMSDPSSSHGNSNSVYNTYGNTSTSYKIIKFT